MVYAPAMTEPQQRATQIASERVAAIVEAAEQAAEDLRAETERRAREHIAEADRASTNRVEAAEAEARDLVNQAREQAVELRSTAQADAQRALEEARAERLQLEETIQQVRTAAEEEARRIRERAEAELAEARRVAQESARELVTEARDAAREVLRPDRAGLAKACLAILVALAVWRLGLTFELWGLEAMDRFWARERREEFSLVFLLNFAALAYLVAWLLVAGPGSSSSICRASAAGLQRLFTLPALMLLGRHSLQVYAYHVLLAYALVAADWHLGVQLRDQDLDRRGGNRKPRFASTHA
jgi:OpgC protein